MNPETLQSADVLTQWLLHRAVEGLPILSSGPDLAAQYLDNPKYPDPHARAKALVRWESSKSFAAGFVTALGGALTLPLSVPAALGATWLLQARMATGLAHVWGHNVTLPYVKTAVLLAMTGVSTPVAVRRALVHVGERVAGRAVAHISEATLQGINQRVGFRLLASASERGAIRLSRAIPVAGAVLAGAVDAYDCHAVARHANRLFSQDDLQETLLVKETPVLV